MQSKGSSLTIRKLGQREVGKARLFRRTVGTCNWALELQSSELPQALKLIVSQPLQTDTASFQELSFTTPSGKKLGGEVCTSSWTPLKT